MQPTNIVEFTTMQKLQVINYVLLYMQCDIRFVEKRISHNGLCFYIDFALRELFNIKLKSAEETFNAQEQFYLLNYKPANCSRSEFWWSIYTLEGYKARIEVLQDIKKQLENEIAND